LSKAKKDAIGVQQEKQGLEKCAPSDRNWGEKENRSVLKKFAQWTEHGKSFSNGQACCTSDSEL